MSFLQDLFLQYNPFVPLYEQAKHLTEHTSLPSYCLHLDFLCAMDEHHYNLPVAHYKLAAIIPGDVNMCINSQEVIASQRWPTFTHH
jgi:hypothetical protein